MFVTTDNDKSITRSTIHTHVRTVGPRNGQNKSNMFGPGCRAQGPGFEGAKPLRSRAGLGGRSPPTVARPNAGVGGDRAVDAGAAPQRRQRARGPAPAPAPCNILFIYVCIYVGIHIYIYIYIYLCMYLSYNIIVYHILYYIL